MTLYQARWNEKDVQDILATEPHRLAIPAGWTMVRELSRVDIRFVSPDDREVIVVEVQLGGADRSHLTRLLEYMHCEKLARPNAKCHGILVAENFGGVSGRLAEALARTAPVRLYSVSLKPDDGRGRLNVEEHLPPALSEALLEPPNYEAKWTAMDWYPLIEYLVDGISGPDCDWQPKFNKDFIGGARHGGSYNFFAFRGSHARYFELELKLEQNPQTTRALEDAGFAADYRSTGKHRGTRLRHYRVRIEADRTSAQIASLVPLIRQARARWEAICRTGGSDRQ